MFESIEFLCLSSFQVPGKVGNEGFTYHITEHGHEGTCREIMNQPNDRNWYQMLKSEFSFLDSTN